MSRVRPSARSTRPAARAAPLGRCVLFGAELRDRPPPPEDFAGEFFGGDFRADEPPFDDEPPPFAPVERPRADPPLPPVLFDPAPCDDPALFDGPVPFAREPVERVALPEVRLAMPHTVSRCTTAVTPATTPPARRCQPERIAAALRQLHNPARARRCRWEQAAGFVDHRNRARARRTAPRHVGRGPRLAGHPEPAGVRSCGHGGRSTRTG
ncbi:hypothetical protein GCM10027174_35740 [Salinifilum aidingensis]